MARGLPKGLPVRPLPLGGTGEVLGIEVTTGRSGHAPGGVWIHLAIGDGFLYTGDWSAESILYGYDRPTSAVATALLDCSYGGYEKPIAECWRELAPFVERGIVEGDARGRKALTAVQCGLPCHVVLITRCDTVTDQLHWQALRVILERIFRE